jgi:hypothetical protein
MGARRLPPERTIVRARRLSLPVAIAASLGLMLVRCRLWLQPWPGRLNLLHPDPHGHCRNRTIRPAGKSRLYTCTWKHVDGSGRFRSRKLTLPVIVMRPLAVRPE